MLAPRLQKLLPLELVVGVGGVGLVLRPVRVAAEARAPAAQARATGVALRVAPAGVLGAAVHQDGRRRRGGPVRAAPLQAGRAGRLQVLVQTQRRNAGPICRGGGGGIPSETCRPFSRQGLAVKLHNLFHTGGNPYTPQHTNPLHPPVFHLAADTYEYRARHLFQGGSGRAFWAR